MSTLAESIPDTPTSGDPGSDPIPFLPEPKRLSEILRLPPHLRDPWIKSLVTEVHGLARRGTFAFEEPTADDKVIPVMEVYKCKTDQDGMIDKLKCHIVYHGDMHAHDKVDIWNQGTGIRFSYSR